MRRPLLIAYLLVSSLFNARAQGQPCEPSMQVSIEAIQTGGASWVFLAMVDSGNHTNVGVSWNMGDAQASVESGPYITFDFMSPGTYLVCVTVTALDSLGQYCQTTVCEVVVVNPLPSGLCDSVGVDFTGSFENGAFTFVLDDSLGAPVLGVDWNFGDGSYGTGDPIAHTFSGNGPYQVCMTAYLMDQMSQDTCTTTVCHWVYFGPDTLPCEQILIPSFEWSTNGLFCAFFNTSFALGSVGSLLWDFGDGTYSTEETPIHEYPSISSYTVCLTVSLWGGLAPDTCTLAVCVPIDMYPLVTVEEFVQYGSPSLWPVPCSDVLHVSVPPGERAEAWMLFDPQGRVLRSGIWPARAPLELNIRGLAPGIYVLRLAGPGRFWSARFMKS